MLSRIMFQDDKLMFDPLSFNDFPAIMANASKEVRVQSLHQQHRRSFSHSWAELVTPRCM